MTKRSKSNADEYERRKVLENLARILALQAAHEFLASSISVESEKAHDTSPSVQR